jgi:hypothetical protein
MNGLDTILKTFVANDDWSVVSARKLEEELDDYREVPGVQDLQDVLASYSPGGGEYLYDKPHLKKAIDSLLKAFGSEAVKKIGPA